MRYGSPAHATAAVRHRQRARAAPVLGRLHGGVAAEPARRQGRLRAVLPRRASGGEWSDDEPLRVVRGIVAGLLASAVVWVLLGLALWRWLG